MLPFASIQDAQIAMERPLSYWESVWFHYTADVSDFWLYCLNVIFLFLIFNLAPLPSVVIELFKVQAFQKYKLQPGVFNSPSEVYRCYRTVMYTFLTVVGPLQVLSYPTIKLIGIRTSLPLPSVGEILAQVVVYFLIEDYGNYWIHRWLHSNWAYNKIHHVHHEFTAPISFTAPYAHWAEVLLLGIPSFIGPLVVPGHMVTLWLWIALRQIEAIETHSGYDFPWTPTKLVPFYGGSEYHDYHHFIGGKSQSNFASVFTYCDYIYGTDKGYRYQKNFLEQMQRLKRFGQTDGIKNGSIEEAHKKL
eukprot:c12797_g1_i1 orf=380-1291(+)